jgi:hypothetical protein
MNRNDQLKRIVSHNIESIKLEFEKRAMCNVVSIDNSLGLAGVEIMIVVDATTYEPVHFTSIKQIGTLNGSLCVIGFVGALEFDCVRVDWESKPPFLN